jgi:spore germination protein YaaH
VPLAVSHQPTPPPVFGRLASVSVWLPYWNLPAALDATLANSGTVRVAHPFWFEIDGVSSLHDQSGGAGPGAIEQLHTAGLGVIPTVTETAYMGQFTQTLASARKRAALVKALLSVASRPGVDGIDLDFENLAYGNGNTRVAKRLARLYPQMVSTLCNTLHASGHSCEVTVIAKNDAGLQGSDGLNTGVYDYAGLARAADRIQVMAYDDHVPSGNSGPISPMPWVKSVVDYALTQMPAGKLVLGVPAYGYDWAAAGNATTLTASAAEQLAAHLNAPIYWDAGAMEPYFRYRTGRRKHRINHVVWFADTFADYDMGVLAANDKLAGIGLWTPGDENPGLWPELAKLH